jgi:hypothetical protein
VTARRPRVYEEGLQAEEGAPCQASKESARPGEAWYLAAGFRVFQVLVGGRAGKTEITHTTNEPTDPSGIC